MKDIENTILKLCKDIGVYPGMKDCFSIYYIRHFRQAQIKVYFHFIINDGKSFNYMECFIGKNLDEAKKELIEYFYNPKQIQRLKELYEANRFKIAQDWK